jgi:mannosyl-oligosaccharide alpha-1,2-mannosidase
VVTSVPATGLYPNYIHPQSGQWGPHDVSVGALGDSFYEYLYKVWSLAGKPPNSPIKKAYDAAITALQSLIHTSKSESAVCASLLLPTLAPELAKLAICGCMACSEP